MEGVNACGQPDRKMSRFFLRLPLVVGSPNNNWICITSSSPATSTTMAGSTDNFGLLLFHPTKYCLCILEWNPFVTTSTIVSGWLEPDRTRVARIGNCTMTKPHHRTFHALISWHLSFFHWPNQFSFLPKSVGNWKRLRGMKGYSVNRGWADSSNPSLLVSVISSGAVARRRVHSMFSIWQNMQHQTDHYVQCVHKAECGWAEYATRWLAEITPSSRCRARQRH